MEVIVVTRKYEYYEESYSEIIGVTQSEEKADELIQKDKSKRDHKLMSRDEYFSIKKIIDYKKYDILKNEKNCPKNGGTLAKFKYDQLSKKDKEHYDKLKENYDGVTITSDVYYNMSDEERYHFHCLLVYGIDNIPYDDFKQVEEFYLEDNENPQDIYYHKDKFEVQ